MVSCAICGHHEVEKGLMAPTVSKEAKVPNRPLRTPASPAEQALTELKKKIEANSEYVGDKFVSEARAMHDGEAPERGIYGEAKLDDAKKLIEDGIPVAPLPFVPGRKNN